MLSLVFAALIVPIIAVLYEAYPRLINKQFGVDIWTHLLYLKALRKNGNKIPKHIGVSEGFLVEGRYDYPPAFITILSHFSTAQVRKYEYLFSPLFDAVHLLVLFGIVYFESGSIVLSVLTQVLYVLTPIIVLENSSATPRSMGYTLFTITFILLYYYQYTFNPLLLAGAWIAGSLIFVSHRFTTQGFLFFAVFFSLMYSSFLYIGIFVASYAGGLIVSKGFYRIVLNGHLGNLYFWRKMIRYRYYHQVKGDTSKGVETNDVVFKLYNQFLKFPPFVLAITNPWIAVAVYALYSYGLNFTSYFSGGGYIMWWALFSYILALTTTWIPSLRFLGEGQRYLELSAFPTAFIAAVIIQSAYQNSQWYVVILALIFALGALITTIVIQHKAIITDTLRTVTPEMDGMFSYLKKLKQKPKLMCIPHQITTNTIYHTDCPVYVNADYSTIIKISDIYPYLQKSIYTVMKEHDLDMLLLNTTYATQKDLGIGGARVVKTSGPYELIDFRS